MGAYYHQNFQRGKEQLVHHINTNEAPLLNPEAGSGTLPASVSPTMASHKKLFAKIKIPPSSVGRSTSAPEDLAASTSPAAASAAATGDGNTFRDVRDFPQIMREISKAKRLESIAARRKDDFTSVDANNNRPHFYWDDALTSSIMNQPLVALPPSPEPLPYQQQQQTSLLQQQQQQQEIQLLDQRESSYQRDSYGNGANYKNSPDFNSIMTQMQQQQQQSKNARDGNDWDYTQSGQGRSFFM